MKLHVRIKSISVFTSIIITFINYKLCLLKLDVDSIQFHPNMHDFEKIRLFLYLVLQFINEEEFDDVLVLEVALDQRMYHE